jgi:integrase
VANSRRKSIHIGRGATLRLRNECWYLDYNFKGTRSKRSLFTESLQEAEIIARDLIVEAQSRSWGVPIPREVLYVDFLTTYKDYSSLHHSEGTQLLQWPLLERFGRFIVELKGMKRPLLLSDITQEDVSRFQTAEAERTRGSGPRKSLRKTRPATVNIYIRVLSSFFGLAVTRQLLRRNPVAGLKPLPEQAFPNRTLMPEQIQELLGEARKDIPLLGPGGKGNGTSRPRVTPLFEIIRLILNTGMRSGETLHLRWVDIDWDRRILKVPFCEEYKPKDRDARPIGLNEVVLADLRSVFLRRDPECPWVFASPSGKPFERRNALRELKRVSAKAGIGWCNFKTLRRTFASEAARSLLPFVLQGIMGHSSVHTTEKHYIHLRGMGDWVPPVIGA